MRFFTSYNLIRPLKTLTLILSIISILWLLIMMLVSSFLGVSLFDFQLGFWEVLFLMLPFVLALTFLFYTLILTVLEVIYRIANDSVVNFIESNKQSQYFRRFLQLDEKQTEEIELGSIKRFNCCVSFLTVNVTDDSVEIIIPLPTRIESYNILKSRLPDIREVASNRMPNYTFQPVERGDFYFKITGRKN